MSTILDMISVARHILNDEGGAPRWSDADMMERINEGIRLAVTFDPTVHNEEVTISLGAGTEQVLPGAIVTPVRFLYNVASKSGITEVDLAVIDRESNGTWRSAAEAVDVIHVMHDREHVDFYVYPPNTGAGEIVCLAGTFPAEITATSDIFEDRLHAKYRYPITEYLLARCLVSDLDAEDQTTFNRVQYHIQNYLSALQTTTGVRDMMDTLRTLSRTR